MGIPRHELVKMLKDNLPMLEEATNFLKQQVAWSNIGEMLESFCVDIEDVIYIEDVDEGKEMIKNAKKDQKKMKQKIIPIVR